MLRQIFLVVLLFGFYVSLTAQTEDSLWNDDFPDGYYWNKLLPVEKENYIIGITEGIFLFRTIYVHKALDEPGSPIYMDNKSARETMITYEDLMTGISKVGIEKIVKSIDVFYSDLEIKNLIDYPVNVSMKFPIIYVFQYLAMKLNGKPKGDIYDFIISIDNAFREKENH